MKYALLGLSFRNVAMIVLAMGAVSIGACSSNVGSSASPVADRAIAGVPTYSWSSWVTVTPSPGDPTEVTGINNLNPPEVVGFYSIKVSTTYSQSISFTADGASYSPITYTSYPRVHGGGKQTLPPMGTQMNGIATQGSTSQLPILAGWVNQPGDQGGTWPVVDDQGLWALERNGQGGATGTNGQTAELFGINKSDIAVGCLTSSPATSAVTACAAADAQAQYFKTDGTPVAFQLDLTKTPSSSSAYGIDDAGDVVGTATLSSGNVSWYALCIKNCPTAGYTGTSTPSYCYATLTNGSYTSTTTAYGISTSGIISGGSYTKLVVGSYTEGTGTAKVTHGFLAEVRLNVTTNACTQLGTPQTIDEPNADKLTVVRGVNNAGYIVGYYNNKKTSGHLQAGFVGIPSTTPTLRRARTVTNHENRSGTML